MNALRETETMNYMNGVTGTATMQQLQQASPQVQAPTHSQRINVLEDSLNTAHERTSQLEKLVQELFARIG